MSATSVDERNWFVLVPDGAWEGGGLRIVMALLLFMIGVRR